MPVYVSTTKLDDLTADFKPSFWTRVSATVGFAIPPVQLAVSLKDEPRSRSAIREQVERTLRKQRKLGDVDEPPPIVAGQRRYVVGELDMLWAIDESVRPQIAWFLGSTQRTLVALGGRARHLTEVSADELKDNSPRGARLQHVERSVVADLARRIEPRARATIPTYSLGSWVQDVLTLSDYWQSEPKEHVRFLAVVEEYAQAGEFGANNPPNAVMLGSPVFVFRTD